MQINKINVCALAMFMAFAIVGNVSAVNFPTEKLETVVIDSQKFQIEEKDGEVILKKYTGNDRSVFIPKNITVIGTNCFRRCSELERVTFEAGSRLKRIGRSAFFYCKDLKEIAIPASVEEIGDGCFEKCVNLERVTFEAGSRLKRIGERAFYGCKDLKEIAIPASVEVIGKKCFDSCSALERVIFEPGSCLKVIGSSATGSKDRLEIPSGVEMLYGCPIGWWNTQRMDNGLISVDMTEVTIPADIDNLDGYSLSGVSTLRKVVFAPGCKVRAIPYSMFYGCKQIKEIEIPASVEEIGENCFSGCYSLGRVTFEACSSLKRIGKYAFSSCESLRDIEIPASVEEIGEGCLGDCMSLDRVTFAPGSCLKVIGSLAIGSKYKIEIPSGVEMLYGCPIGWWNTQRMDNGLISVDMTEVTIPADIDNLDGYSLSGVSTLRKVVFAPGCKVRAIPARMFNDCRWIKAIEIPAGVEELNEQLFEGCSSLEKVIFAPGSNLKRIGKDAFVGCGKLKEVVNLPADVEILDDTILKIIGKR